MRRTVIKGGIIAALAAGAVCIPIAAANAAVISGSTVWFNLSSDRHWESGDWRGPGSGRARACGDVQKSTQTSPSQGLATFRDIAVVPDMEGPSRTVYPDDPALCTQYGNTSTGFTYYTRFSARKTTGAPGGWAQAGN